MEEYLEETIKTYDETAKEYAKNVAGIVPINELEKFVSNIPCGGKIIDIGSGSGEAAKILSERGYEVHGIDLSKNLLVEAMRQAPLANFHWGDMRDLIFTDEYFDGVLHIASLLHLKKEDVPRALREASRVLKHEGIMYLSVKGGEGESLELDKRYNGKPKWYTYFQEEEINNLLKKSGFKVLENYSIQYKDNYRIEHPWMSIFCKKN